MDNNLQLLGIAKKAGLIAIGEESVFSAARTGKAKAVFSASDASNASKRRANRYSEEYGAVYAALPYTKEVLGTVIGRGSPGMLAVLDTGLAAGFVKGLAAGDPAGFGEAAERLSRKAERMRRRRIKNSGKRGTAQ